MRGGQLARCLTTKTRIDAGTETLIPTFGGVFSFAATDYKTGEFEEVDVARSLTTSADRTRAAPVCVTSDITHTLKAEGFDASEDGTGRGQPIVAHAIQAGALRTNPNSGPDGVGVQADVAYTLEARSEVQCAQFGMAVRRLTPRECERLQGFPDDYTLIPGKARKKVEAQMLLYLRLTRPDISMEEARRLAADGPRYKTLGNSMAVPCMKWIGERIQAVIDIQSEREAA